MRMHILIDDDLLAELDRRVGRGHRSAYVVELVRRAMDNAGRRDAIETGLGSIKDGGHDWDADPAAWVRAQRRADTTRVG